MNAPGTRLERLLDTAVRRSRGPALAAALRAERPTATPAELVTALEERYLSRAGLLGGGVGAVAAVPAFGTGTAAALTVGQAAAFLAASGNYVMAVATLHGVEVDDVERRRTLLMAALLGKDGAEAVSGQLGLGTLAWAKAALTKLPIGTVRAVNKTLARRLVRTAGARAGALALGRLAPFGVGAAIGRFGTRAVAKNVVSGVRAAFGPAPATFVASSA